MHRFEYFPCDRAQFVLKYISANNNQGGYHYINVKKTWTEAQQYCREKHTDLATVSDIEGLKRLINKSPAMTEAWIGLYDQTNGIRRWYWSLPGVEFSENETEWNSGEPNDRNTENCGCILKSLKWIDLSCERPEHFLCYDEKFYLIKQEKTWLEAQSYCRENHTDLPSGLDQLQGERLKNVLSSTGGKYVFIGLMRDTWRWSDGSSFSFRHWNKDFDDEENKTWEEALSYCRHHHHDLVTITNLEEQRWVQEKAKKASTPFVWLGLRFNCSLKFWFWVCREAVPHRNQSSDGQMDDCNVSGAMEAGGQHLWFQRDGGEELNFICSMSNYL
uniref:C-type lectin domain-containing protein n=1 Tax=Fundulus heteroclitus TaxID=8078 RepID=A0A3Q2TGV1_FUNHE